MPSEPEKQLHLRRQILQLIYSGMRRKGDVEYGRANGRGISHWLKENLNDTLNPPEGQSEGNNQANPEG